MSERRSRVSRRRFLASTAGGGAAWPAASRARRPGEADDHLLERADRRRRQGHGRADRPVHQRDGHPDRAAAHPVGRSLRQAPGVGARGRGAGPGADPHRRGAPLRHRRRARADRRQDALAGKGFRAEDYLASTWQGGIFQGKRYSLPLDVPQHILYLNARVMKQAGLAGADGRPRVPATRDELVAHGQAAHQGRHVRLRHRHRQPREVHLGLPQPALAERRQRLRPGSEALGPDRSRRRRGRGVLGRARRRAQDRPARQRQLPRRVHRGQARHVARRLVELHRAARGQGRLHGRAGAAALQAAGGVVDAAPVQLPQAEGRRRAPSARRRGRTSAG